MSVVISLSDVRAEAAPRPALSVHGVGRVAFAAGLDGVARVRDLYQHDPIRIVLPTPPRAEIPSAVFVTTSGGLVGGDVLELTARAFEDVAVQYLPQSAEKVYRSAGADCRIAVTLDVRRGAWLEWLPQETIVFDGARLVRRTAAEVAKGARLLAGDILVLGRGAMGETVRHGLVRDEWEIRRAGKLVWADALRLDGAIAETARHPAGLGGATAVATVVYAADDVRAWLEPAREMLAGVPDGVRAGATVVGGVLLARFLAADPYPLRQAYGDFWAAFRNAAAGLPAELPRLWHI